MQDELLIDDAGRFQMASDDLEAFVEFLRENKIPCSVQEPKAFIAAGRSYSYGRIDHRYDAEVAETLFRQWKTSHIQG